MNKKKNGRNKICSEDEFERFISIHKRSTALRKEFHVSIEKRSDGFSLRRIDLDEDSSAFWPTMKKIGQKVGVDLPDTPALIKAIINEEEEENLYANLGYDCVGGVWFDGKYMDEIELADRMRENIEEQSIPRNELIKNIDRIMVRLCKHFGVQPDGGQNTECHNANRVPKPETTTKANSKPEPAEPSVNLEKPSHSIDFRSVNWFGTNYNFTG